MTHQFFYHHHKTTCNFSCLIWIKQTNNNNNNATVQKTAPVTAWGSCLFFLSLLTPLSNEQARNGKKEKIKCTMPSTAIQSRRSLILRVCVCVFVFVFVYFETKFNFLHYFLRQLCTRVPSQWNAMERGKNMNHKWVTIEKKRKKWTLSLRFWNVFYNLKRGTCQMSQARAIAKAKTTQQKAQLSFSCCKHTHTHIYCFTLG